MQIFNFFEGLIYHFFFISAFREGYSTQHVLLRLIREWQKRLGNDYIVGDDYYV